jgi:eukaryotic-like serine/threonine-protein kinase
LHDKGRLEGAITEYKKAIELDPKLVLPHKLLRQCEQMIALDKKLVSILKGDAKPADAAEQIALAQLCQIKKRHVATARFYADAFTAQPKLAEDLRASHRYNAACSAALAAAGQGEDAGKLDDKERARLRKQALDWLRGDFVLWGKQMESGQAAALSLVRQTLQHWQTDADLAGLRDTAALAKMPASERTACQKLWLDVAALRKKGHEKGQP